MTQATEEEGNQTSVKILIALIGSGVMVMVIGCIFWMGSTYTRIQGIETHLASIDIVVSKMGDLQILEERSIGHEKRIEKLEDSVFKLETDKKFGN